jgi:hypothetical protein
MSHAYDNPELSAKEFLLAVMRDRDVPLYLRLKAAKAVAPYTVQVPEPERVVHPTPEHNVLQ